ncbi:hypothetical protein AB0P15_09835 [Streptomyces sp. NPDC087917]|uniref:hypothetical protein n=1 Tax=unclassified Streptomyces TaxID=2593676 RepID=UPI003415D738
MSQRGAQDWWQKLYEDPEAAPEPDPGDTLDQRFRSAAVVVTDPEAAARAGGSIPGPRDPQPPPDTPARSDTPATPATPDAPATPAPPERRPAILPGMRSEALPESWPDPAPPPTTPPGPVPSTSPGPVPSTPPGPAPDPGAEPPHVPRVQPPQGLRAGLPPAPRPEALPESWPRAAPGARFETPPGARPEALPESWPDTDSRPDTRPAGGPGRGLPPGAGPQGSPSREAFDAEPRDPRVGGETGYARGSLTVPPVPPAEPAGPPDPPVPAPAAPPPVPAPEASPAPPAPPEPPEPASTRPERPAVRHLGDRAPTYAAEPEALPAADPAALGFLTPDTALEGARYGTYTLRAASVRGDSARFRGEARRDFLLTARFGSGDDGLLLVVLAGGDRAAPGAREAAADLGHCVAAAVGRSRERLADDIRGGRREALLSGLQRLTDRGYGRLRARAAELGLAEEAYTAGLRALLLPLDPLCANRICFGAGAGGLFRLRAGHWQDLEPDEPPTGDEGGAGGFRFRAAVARPGDTLLLCSGGLAEPLREESVLPAELAARWSDGEPPGLAAFLADTQLRLKGYADDRTAAAIWEA